MPLMRYIQVETVAAQEKDMDSTEPKRYILTTHLCPPTLPALKLSNLRLRLRYLTPITQRTNKILTTHLCPPTLPALELSYLRLRLGIKIIKQTNKPYPTRPQTYEDSREWERIHTTNLCPLSNRMLDGYAH